MLRTQHSKAFTLLELIVVIVVLGLLAAIAVPTFQKVIDKSGDASATATLGQLGKETQALAAFRADGTVVSADVTEAGADLGGYTVKLSSAGSTGPQDVVAATTGGSDSAAGFALQIRPGRCAYAKTTSSTTRSWAASKDSCTAADALGLAWTVSTTPWSGMSLRAAALNSDGSIVGADNDRAGVQYGSNLTFQRSAVPATWSSVQGVTSSADGRPWMLGYRFIARWNADNTTTNVGGGYGGPSGSATYCPGANSSTDSFCIDGPMSLSGLQSPRHPVTCPDGRVYFIDGSRIRQIDPAAATVRTVYGNGTSGNVVGTGTAATFSGGDLACLADNTLALLAGANQLRLVSTTDFSSRALTVSVDDGATLGALSLSPSGRVFFASVRRVYSGPVLTATSSSVAATAIAGSASNWGTTDGDGLTAATFNTVADLVAASDSRVLVVESHGWRVITR